MSELVVIYTLVENKEDARRLGYDLVDQGLAVCVNLFPEVESIYPWEGAVQSSGECALLIKTRTGLCDQLSSYLEEHHPYRIPAIIRLKVDDVNVSFAQWLRDHLQGKIV